jgi:Dit-like tail protein
MPIVDLSGATFTRSIAPDVATGGGLVAEVTISEDHEDELLITDHPVELGAMMSDHAYKRPPTLRLRVGWSNAYGKTATYARSIYAQLLNLQVLRQPFQVYTGKRFYANMLVQLIREVTDKNTEYVLLADISLRQVFLVSTKTTSAASVNPNPNAQLAPQATGTTIDSGAQQTQAVGGTSIVTGAIYVAPGTGAVPGPLTNSNGGGVSTSDYLDYSTAGF